MVPSIKALSLKAPPPRAVLLSDALFFVRVIPITEGATRADVGSQVELALEGLAPFPLAQMYYAHHWIPGTRSAVVYAAYKKRFTTQETDTWSDAEMVLPRFATLLTARVEKGTAALLTSEDGATLIHWGGEKGEPSAVLTRTWSGETSEAEKLRLRDEVLRSTSGTRSVIEIDRVPEVERGRTDFVFRAGRLEAPLTREQLDSLDVRDKTELAARRRARMRDVFLWQAFLACAAGLAIAALLEVCILAGGLWHRSRQAMVEAQAPAVAEIMRAQALATRIDELSTNRLRPLEMITLVAERKPTSVLFARATTTGLYSLEVEAYTNTPTDVSNYQAALRQVPAIAKVDVQNQAIREGTSVFRLLVTFKPEAFRPAKS